MTIDLQQYSPEILVELPVGVYLLPVDSASGKTYLCESLRELATVERVNSYTYSDKSSGLSLASLLDNSKYDLLLLDRYDMYFGDCVTEIKEFAKSGIVLVDCKADELPFPATICTVYLQMSRLVVK